MPKELANQAKPKPAAKPPNMAPHGRLGAAAAAGAPAGAGFAALLAAPWLGVAGVAWRCVTLLDCLPNEEPPPKRRAASALKPANIKTSDKPSAHAFMIAPNSYLST
jgi:hypothetical protein